jgi:alkylated DNA nucleotide flippase Atl1
MADRIMEIWPGPADGGEDDSTGRDWSLLRRACAALPAGAWTTYGDLADLIGSHPVPVGVHLATNPVPNAWRVLTVDGSISPSFRWEASDRTDDPEALLASEGIVFVNSHADAAQRITATELAGLLGMDAGELPSGADIQVSVDSAAGRQFLTQLADAHPDCVEAVNDLLQHWQSLGGVPSFGRASEVSCFLLLYAYRTGTDRIWPFTIHP